MTWEDVLKRKNEEGYSLETKDFEVGETGRTIKGRAYGFFNTKEDAEKYKRMVVGDGEAKAKDLVINKVKLRPKYQYVRYKPSSKEPQVMAGDISNLGGTRPFDPKTDSHEDFIGE